MQFALNKPRVTGTSDGMKETSTVAGYGGDVVIVDVTVEVVVETLV